MFKSQMDWVKAQLLKKGSITRNEALKRYISRLGARINDLRNAGWKIEGRWIKTKYGRDYEYILTK